LGELNAPSRLPVPVPPESDGRRRRSQRSRDKIIAAVLALVEGGAITPSAEDVAARAGVGLRSVFRHFRDMESLFLEITLQLATDYQRWLVPYASADWRGQLAETIDRRLTTYERLLPFKRAADAHRHGSTTLEMEHQRVGAMMRARLEAIMVAPLAGDAVSLEALDMLISFEIWLRLRLEQNLDPSAARAVIERQVEILLAHVPRTEGR